MKVVTFDISSTEFVIYTENAWNAQIQEWREELSALEEYSEWAEEDVVEAMCGDEFFYEKVESL
jgi:UDP-glucose 6-dehydrogenase